MAPEPPPPWQSPASPVVVLDVKGDAPLMPEVEVPPCTRWARAGAGMRRIRARWACRKNLPGPSRLRHAMHPRTPCVAD
jgi:hypothetical protein